MLVEEAKWLAACFARMPDTALFPFVNVGSSTAAFRAVEQPYIEAEVFAPLARRGAVVHVDIKAATGVDLVGDITDAGFVERLTSTVPAKAVCVSNLLEHVTDPEGMARAALALVPSGGLIFVSGPQHYPYHADPIDNGFRPTVPEVHQLFPGTTLIDSAVIPSSLWRPWGTDGGTRAARARYFARLCFPLYRPASWWRAIRASAFMPRGVSAYAVVLAKGAPS